MNLDNIFETPSHMLPEKMNFIHLTPIVRALLTTDGSFTLLLEAFTGEKIIAQPIESKTLVASSDSNITILQVSPGDKLLFRSALLKTSSGVTAAYVESITVLGRVSEQIRKELTKGSRKPIGKMLRGERLETFREIIEMEMVADSKATRYLGPGQKPMRKYVIFSNNLPLMAITEYINIQ